MDMPLLVSPSPHILENTSVSRIMGHVSVALLPTVLAAGWIFGRHALLLIVVSALSCMAMEYVWCVFAGWENSVGDGSALVTGLLLGLNLSPTLPLWMAMVGAFVAIVVVKMLFGGLGCNFANPAIVARLVLMLSFTEHMTSYVFPSNGIDVFSAATPLSISQAVGAEVYGPLLLGNIGGMLGETCALSLLLGGCYLMIRRIISPMVPLSYLGSVALFSALLGHDPIYQLLSGGLMLGAFFMATDYVTSPYTPTGRLIFGLGLGALTCLIRFFGTAAEGVSYAILLMNLLTPQINAWTMRRGWGGGRA